MTRPAFAAIVLAGGAASRLGGVRKPALPVAGRSMLDRVLHAVAEAQPRIVVGPTDLGLPPGVLRTTEKPPGGGPVAAAAAGLALVPADLVYVALLAADLPLLTAPAVRKLHEELRPDTVDAAIYVDDAGRRQWLCGMWRTARLRALLDRLAAQRGDLSGASMRTLVGDAQVTGVSWAGSGPPPWFDCDTDPDLRRAEEWAR